MPSMTAVKCARCGKKFEARTADVNRGWGKFCSKSCKSKFKGGPGRTPWGAAGVSRETYLHYAQEYGGTPLFDRSGQYTGFMPGPFDNTLHQNHDPND